jgi:molecular chaperone GrpE
MTKKDKTIKENIPMTENNEKIDIQDNIEEPVLDNQEIAAQETPEEDSLELELDKMTQERDEFKDKWLRTLAEFDNYRKNTLKEKADWMKYANEKIILEICEVFDNFERSNSIDLNENNLESFKKGIDLIYQQIETLLKKNNVSKIECLDKEFDPNFHEALAHIPSELDENTITNIIQNGYKMNDKVIRPARVAVSNGIKPENPNHDKKENNK